MAVARETKITMAVNRIVCSLEGQFTWLISALVALIYSVKFMFLLKNPSGGLSRVCYHTDDSSVN
jgi:hypothetical protein